MNIAEAPQANPVALAEQHDQIPNGLPNELVQTLAVLHDADESDAQALIASLPYGSRVTLSAYGLIERIYPKPGAISPIAITEAGRRTIGASAEIYSPSEGDEARWAAELQAADAAYRAGRLSLPDFPGLALSRVRELIERRRSGRRVPL
ncbi:MAG: hypothetical protein ACYDHN_14000 [Solirubrobacteraceae bacterium]